LQQILIVVLNGATAMGCGSGAADVPLSEDRCASQGAACAVQEPEYFDYVLRFTQNQRGEPSSGCESRLCAGLKVLIEAATRTIDFALYGIREQPDISAALAAAQERGVQVRGVVDSESQYCGERGSYAYPDTPTLVEALAEGAVVCDNDSQDYDAIMHNKFFVFDGASVWTGSTNVSDSETGGENHGDVVAIFGSRRLAEIYSSEFDEMYRGRFHRDKYDNTQHRLSEDYWSDGTTRVESYFSPSDDATVNAILPLIDSAEQTLDVTSFVLTDDAIGDALVAARERDVQVRVILDADGSRSTGSEWRKLCAAGVRVKVEDWPNKQHGKWAVADGRRVIFGSQNWTAAGNQRNDENTLLVDNDDFAAEFEREFARQWADLAALQPCASL
jgi:phosphatidylserine/phosphatidylglycerophosphate/cardiolipin synthase-like enzyme